MHALRRIFLQKAICSSDSRRVLLLRKHVHSKVILGLEPRYLQLIQSDIDSFLWLYYWLLLSLHFRFQRSCLDFVIESGFILDLVDR